MTVYFRLLAGFTSLTLKRCVSQRVSMGPDGIFASSSMIAPLVNDAGQYRDRNGNIAGGNHYREHRRKLLDAGRIPRMAQPHRLEHAPDAVVEVHAQQNHRHD